LARCFRRFFRCTPGDLLRLRRLQKAAALILHRDLPLADIAMHCGFTDQSHMTTAFRLVYGTSPGRYRRLTRPAAQLVSFLQDTTSFRDEELGYEKDWASLLVRCVRVEHGF